MTTKRQLANLLTAKNKQLSTTQALHVIEIIIKFLTTALMHGQRVEIRGFGAFSIRKRTTSAMRNPKTNQPLPTLDLNRVYFRPSKNLIT